MKGAAIGINLGTHSARAAFAPSGKNAKLIPNRWGKTAMPAPAGWRDCARLDLQERLVPLILTLREDAEVHLNDFVSSCVLAIPEGLSGEQKEGIVRSANAAGIAEAGFISEPCAAALAMGCNGRSLILDFGAKTALSVVEFRNGEGNILESVEAGLPGGRDYDEALAAWLRERLRLSLKEGDPRQTDLIREAEKIKIALSDAKSIRWTPPVLEDGQSLSPADWPFPKLTICREDLECLIRFSLRQIIHTACRLWTQYAPTHLIQTGGSNAIPLLREIFRREGPNPRHRVHGTEDAVVRGAAVWASRGAPFQNEQEPLSDASRNWAQQLQDLKMSLLELETLLTHSQQDQLHILFQRAESAPPAPELLRIMKGLVHDLQQAVE
ncbi:MAG: Hsp70 family protein [Fretibacterium sp.]|nr:Hsp70 family protein [Fretibacterium sp.]